VTNVQNRRDGFTIVEVLIAIVILAVGMLALATTSIFATTQVKVADLKTEQSVAVQQTIESLRAMPFDSVRSRAEVNRDDLGTYDVWWTVTSTSRYLKNVLVFTLGPGYQSGSWVPAQRDTFTVQITENLVN
jgi:prepilin-type N-terminal cleavage/methylation domain-containing protein